MNVQLHRRYRLSASHRLHSDAYTDEQNRAVFGKCNNPFGHGHNYIITVTVSGPVNPGTGMITNLADLDAFAEKELIARFDHQNLNTLPAFQHVVPSTENLCIEVHRIFSAYPHARLERIRIEETNNNSFEYSGAPASE
jgi:6-pyruvoyltetrahydropterin/6-carboxytetrahydropterin synthase